MWYFTEMVFCTRKWEQDRKTVSKSLLHLRDYPEKYFVRETLCSHAPTCTSPALVHAHVSSLARLMPGLPTCPANLPCCHMLPYPFL